LSRATVVQLGKVSDLTHAKEKFGFKVLKKKKFKKTTNIPTFDAIAFSAAALDRNIPL
jgi:hypothetical protein